MTQVILLSNITLEIKTSIELSLEKLFKRKFDIGRNEIKQGNDFYLAPTKDDM